MAYDRYYTGGWQDGESGNTPITAASLNHIEDGLVTITEPSALTITYVSNSYVTSASVANLYACKKSGFLYLRGNLFLNNSVPSDTSDTQIATISGWNAISNIQLTVAGQAGGGTLIVSISSSGSVTIANSSGTAAINWHRFTLVVPAND